MKGANHDIIFSYKYHVLLLSCQNGDFFPCTYNFRRSYKNGFKFAAVLIPIKTYVKQLFKALRLPAICISPYRDIYITQTLIFSFDIFCQENQTRACTEYWFILPVKLIKFILKFIFIE